MVGSRRTKIYTVVFLLALLGAFFCYGFLRGYFFTTEVGTILYMMIMGAWSFTIRRRILNQKSRNLLTWTCYGMMFWFLLRIIKYDFVKDEIWLRICWYLYYIPMTALPFLLFYLAVLTRRLEKKTVPKKIPYLGLLLIPMNLLVLTNDLHQLVFRFGMPASKWKDGMPYTYGPFYYVVIVWAAVLGIASFVLLIQKSTFARTRKLAWIPIVPILIGIYLLLILITGRVPRANGLALYQLHEVVCFMCIGFLEACIRIGLIPSNEGYEVIFAQSSVAAKVVDKSGNVIYESDEKMELSNQMWEKLSKVATLVEEDTRYNRVPLQGGHFLWSEDLTKINQINEDLREAAEVIADENLILQEENKLKEDEIRFKTLNHLYDTIAETVHAQVVQIEALLLDTKDEKQFRKNMAKAAFLNAYIKRRSNLSLLGERQEVLELEELYLAQKESLLYLGLCEKATYIEPFSEHYVAPSSMLFDAYDFFQLLLEQCFDALLAVMVTVRSKEGALSIRFTLELEKKLEVLPDTKAKTFLEQEEDTAILTLLYEGEVSKV